MLIKFTWLDLARDEAGATAVEYGLIVALIVIAMITALDSLANATITMWTDVATDVSEVTTPE